MNDGDEANYRAAGFAYMAQVILDGRAHKCSFEMSLHVVEVMTTILRAGQEARWIDVETICDRPSPLGPDEARALMA